MPKKNCLKSRSDFERVRSEGRVVKGNLFLLSFLKNNLSFSRFGIIVSKSVSSKATKRNRIKRLIREFVRNNIFPVLKGYDVLIVARKQVLGREEEIYKELGKLFGLIKE